MMHAAAEKFGDQIVRKLGREGGKYLRKYLGDIFDDMVDYTDKDGKHSRLHEKRGQRDNQGHCIGRSY